MKLLSPILAALLAAMNTAAAAGTTYIAPGVNAGDLAASTQFYDCGKGYYYWNSHTETTRGLYEQTGDYSFMGELAGYISATEYSEGAFEPLNKDSITCWYNAGANAIQYWQNSYGVFYKGDRPLPYGYTYSRDNLKTLAGTQSLEINMHFYDNWKDQGGAATDAFDWYLGGYDSSGVSNGKFFNEYFLGTTAGHSVNLFDGPGQFSMQKATEGIIGAFGLELGEDGTLQRTEEGLIATLSASNNIAAHALTCYGFSLDESGLLDSLYIADSDDAAYNLEHVYLGLSTDGGRLLMYEDEERTRGWHSEGPFMWCITGIYNIVTPESLKELYAKYHDEKNPLVWNGSGTVWADTADTPAAQGPWSVSVDGTQYGSNFENGRILRFEDGAERRDITVQGHPEAARIQLVNAQDAYSFTGAEGASLRIRTLEKEGAAAAVFKDMAVQADTLALHEAALGLDGTASLKIGGVVNIIGGEIKSTTDSTYSLDNAGYSISNATVEVLDNSASTFCNALENARLVNAGKGKLAVDSNITGTFSVEARGGDIDILNCGTLLTMNDLTLHDGRTVGAYVADTISEAAETGVLVKGTLTAGKGSRLNANLTLGTGATLDVSGADGLGLMLGSALTLNTGLSLSERDMELIAMMSVNETYGLFQGVDALTLAGLDRQGPAPVFEDAAGWFTGMESGRYFIQWNGDNVGMVGLLYIPEPSTSTLSLLALCALLARRRRF